MPERRLSLQRALDTLAPHVRVGLNPPGARTDLENFGRCALTYLRVAYQQGVLIRLAVTSGNRDAMEAALGNLRSILDVAPDMYALVRTGKRGRNGQKALIFAVRELERFLRASGASPSELETIDERLNVLRSKYPDDWLELESAKNSNYWFGLRRAEAISLLDKALAIKNGTAVDAMRSAYKVLSWDTHNVLSPLHYWTDASPPVLTERRHPEDLVDFVESMATSFLAALLLLYLEVLNETGPPASAS